MLEKYKSKPIQKNDMYLHKLVNFKEMFDHFFNHIQIESLCEIGIETADFSQIIEQYLLQGKIGHYYGVDIAISHKIKGNCQYFESTSLEFLASKDHTGFDVYLIDGDHNYYTVDNELKLIFSRENGKKICFLHDTNWPAAYRDFYYHPANIPTEYQQPMTSKKRVMRNNNNLSDYGFWGDSQFYIAEKEGGTKNGIACAIDDFILEKPELTRIDLPQFLGLTILYNEQLLTTEEKLWFEKIQSFVTDYPFFYNNLAQLEYNRLINYTDVLKLHQINAEQLTIQQNLVNEHNKLLAIQQNLVNEHNQLLAIQQKTATDLQKAQAASYYSKILLINEQARSTCNNAEKHFLSDKLIHRFKFKYHGLTRKVPSDKKLSNLSQFLSKVPHRTGLISFDFFDTLVVRSIEPPERVKLKVAEMSVEHIYRATGIIVTIEQYTTIRDRVELALRIDNIELHSGDHEATLKEIITDILVYFECENSGLIKRLMHDEIILESEVLMANEGVLPLLNQLKKNGHRIIVISDMYLSQAHICYIAEKIGFNHLIDKIYVSGDIGMAKYSSRLYHYVAKQEGVAISDIYHIGDNYHADYHTANLAGVNAFWLYQTSNLNRRFSLEKKIKNTKDRYIANLIKEKDTSKNAIESVLFNALSPLVFSMAYKNIKDCLSLGINNLFFLAREGISLKYAYELLLARHPEFNQVSINTKVLYCSRASTISANYDGPENIDIIAKLIYRRFGHLSYDNLLKTWSVQQENFSYQPIDKPIVTNEADLYHLFCNNDFVTAFDNYQRAAKELFFNYLQQEGVFNEDKAALVDVGWGGSIQKSMQSLDANCTFFGCYIGTNSLYGLNNFSGYIYQENDPRIIAIVKSAPIIETLLSVDSVNTTKSYTYINGRYEPVFGDKQEQTGLEPIRNIAFDNFVEIFIELTRNHCFLDREMLAYSSEAFYQFITNPPKKFVKELENYCFSMDWGSDDQISLIKKLRLRDMRHPRTFVNEMASCSWVFASIKNTHAGFMVYPLRWYMSKNHSIKSKVNGLIRRIYQIIRR